MPEIPEKVRLEKLYESLRERLLDMSLRNPMLSYKHRATSKRQLQIVDEVPENVYNLLTDGGTLEIVALPEPDDTPLDERTEEFASALEHARVSDIEHLTKLQALESTGRDDEFEMAKVDRELRDRVRTQLGLSPRPNRKTVNPVEHARELDIDPSFELSAKSSKETHSDRKLQTLKWPDSLESALERISDDARLAEQETGLSTLFLVFGFLEWNEREEGKKLFAPLLMLPVKLDKRKTARGKIVFFLSATAETAEANLSLQKKIERDFGRSLPNFDAGEDGGSVEEYFEAVRKTVDGQKGWQVRHFLTLGHFPFGRFAMYADLAPTNWNSHPVEDKLVGAIVRGTEMTGDGGSSLLGPPEDYPVDDPEIEKIAPILIHDADASQHSALVDVMKAKNLVIQGPPGTGKSQTITNIIANVLADGRSVLFLAEKQAALDVVKRRLAKADLGDFCLELHSDKAAPRLVIESLHRRAKHGFGKQPNGLAQQLDVTWDKCRKEVAAYVDALHAAANDGKAPFDLIWRSLRARSEVGPILDTFRAVSLPGPVLTDASTFKSAYGGVSIYARMADSFASSYGPPATSPWGLLSYQRGRRPTTTGLLIELAKLRDRAEAVASDIAELGDLGVDSLPSLTSLIELDQRFPDISVPSDVIARVSGLDQGDVETIIALQINLRRIRESLADHPELQQARKSDFALATSLLEMVAGRNFAKLTPAELYVEASRQGAAAETLLDGLRRLLPTVEILGSPHTLPSGGIQALVLASHAASRLTDETRPWFNWTPAGGSAAFETVRSEWAHLVAEEARWRGRFSGYTGATWPTPDELRAAAGVAAKGSLGRMLGALKGEGKTLAAVVERLGIASGTRVPAEDLTGLADHAQAIAAFINNRSHQQLLGGAWAGLDSPFGRIASVLAMRATALEKIAEVQNGGEIAERLTDLDETELVRLAATHEATKAAFGQIGELRTELDATRFTHKVAQVEHTRADIAAILAVDPTRSLERFRLPLADLVSAMEAETARRTTSAHLQEHALYPMVDELAGGDAAIAATFSAAAWSASVRKTLGPGVLRDALLSREAPAVRARIATVAPTAALASASLKAKLGEVERLQGVSGFDTTNPRKLVTVINDLLARRDELTEFLVLRDQRSQVVGDGLEPFLEAADKAGVAARLLPELLSGLVAQRRADKARETDPVLSSASGLRIEARRKEFIERDRRKIESDRQRVRDRLLAPIPPTGVGYGPKRHWTDMELLRNEFGKEKRFVPVRELMRRAGVAVQTLKPCFMMSPLSLAKFLPVGSLQFDLVVIDEASQMRPEDALGGLLRAKQLVVVGDQKQLPPTDFFARLGESRASVTEDEEDFEDLDDESILEACQKTFRETRMLRWHYRSRCESLIGFSNQEFYKNELITFPMAKPGSFSVDLIRVNGHNEARRNPAEAQSIAEEAIQFMRHHAEHDIETIPTLGIVAVNSDQRDLIFEEIRRMEADDALVEVYREKVAERGEPVFVKNLENVQGDERDFILISMTYGPKPGASVMSQRFGPINGKQGHRRLNVLFSRARVRIGLFTSFGSVDIKPSETSAQGVHVLKRYLEYAENRGRAVGRSLGPEVDSDFETEVADRLRLRGYVVDYQVGVSGFRIDLGIRHPDHPERYLAGVECDGARYHSSKSARDRDRLREEVLRSLGWDLVRVWSTDWFDNPDLQTERLIKQLEELKARPAAVHGDYQFTGASFCSEAEWDHEAGPRESAKVDTAAADIDRIAPREAKQEGLEATEVRGEEALGPTQAPDVESLFGGTGALSETDLARALREFRDTVIAVEMTPWEQHRSILREAMVETFIAQRITDPVEWFSKVPQYQRQGTNPAEKTRYIERVCDLVARLESKLQSRGKPPAFVLTPPPTRERPHQGSLFGAGSQSRAPVGIATPDATGAQPSIGPAVYVTADVVACGIDPNPARFSEPGYLAALSKMVSHVVATEGPIYVDQLVTRIARAHGFQRNGGNIVETVRRAIDRRFPRSVDDGRELVWPLNATQQGLVPLRNGNGDPRDHSDIPIVELASLALPYVARGKMNDEDILERMRAHFGLARLREPTRQRFIAAIKAAKGTSI